MIFCCSGALIFENFLVMWVLTMDFFFFFFDIRFGSWKIFGHVILGHGNFLSCNFFVGMGNDELNFCVAKPQELR